MSWNKKDRPAHGCALCIFLFLCVFVAVRMSGIGLFMMGIGQGFQKTFQGLFMITLAPSQELQVLGAVFFMLGLFMALCVKAVFEWKRWGIWGLAWVFAFIALIHLVSWFMPKTGAAAKHEHLREMTFHFIDLVVLFILIFPIYEHYDKGLPFQGPKRRREDFDEGDNALISNAAGKPGLLKSIAFNYKMITESTAMRMFKRPKGLASKSAPTPDDPGRSLFDTACHDVLNKQHDKAIKSLSRAVLAGFRDDALMNDHPMMERLKAKRPEEYAKLFDVVKKKADAKRARQSGG